MKRYIKIELPPDVMQQLLKQIAGTDYLPSNHFYSIDGFLINGESGIELHVYDSAERQENIRISNLD